MGIPRARELCSNRLVCALYVEAEEDDVAILNDVLFPFETHQTLLLGRSIAPRRFELLVGDHLGPDKAALHVRMDHSRRRNRRGASSHVPGPHLSLVGGEEGDEIQELVRGQDHPVPCQTLHPEFRHELGCLLRRELGKLHLELSHDLKNRRPRLGTPDRRTSSRPSLRLVNQSEHGLGGEKGVASQWGGIGDGRVTPERAPRLEGLSAFLEKAELLRLLLFPSLAIGGDPLETFLHDDEIRDDELGFDAIKVFEGISGAMERMREIPHHVDEGVNRADGGEEGVSQWLLLVCAPGKAPMSTYSTAT